MKDLFIAATGQDRGKTSFCVGLLAYLREKLGNISYMKPVGNRYITLDDGTKVDEDVKLIDSIYNFGDDLRDVSPIIIDSGFTRHCIDHDCSRELEERVLTSRARIKEGRELLVMEGSGKVSVGEVMKMSNARVAEITNSRVILVAEGGIGNTIDNVMLNIAFLKQFNVDIIGVVINKVFENKIDEIWEKTVKGLRKRGVNVLGVLPYEKMLSSPTLEHICNELKFNPLTCVSRAVLNKSINRIIIGAMTPREALKYFAGQELLITGGDREDIMVSALARTAIHLQSGRGGSVLGIIATGGIKPHDSLLETAENVGILILQAEEDTFTVAAKIRDMTVKLRPNDAEKIKTLKSLVCNNIDLEKLV